MAGLDPQIAAHLEWIGFVRPTGLVVSAPALVKAGALLNRRDAEGQELLRGCVEERRSDAADSASASDPEPRLPDFRSFASSVLGWNFSATGYAGTDEAPIPAELEAVLPDGARSCARISRSGRNRCDAPPRYGRLPRYVKTRRHTALPIRTEQRPHQTQNAKAPHRTAPHPGSYSCASASRARTSTM